MQVSVSLFLSIILVLAGFLSGAGMALIFCKWLPSPAQRDEKRRKKEKARKDRRTAEEKDAEAKTLSEKIQNKPSYVNDITYGNYSERTKKKRKEQTKAYQYLKGRKGGKDKK